MYKYDDEVYQIRLLQKSLMGQYILGKISPVFDNQEIYPSMYENLQKFHV